MPGIDTGGVQHFGGGTHRNWHQTDAKEICDRCGIDGSLELALDAGDSTSYSGSGQTWDDLSGNGYDFNRGATSSSEGSDPTFNGSSGGLSDSEYWSLDGGDYFTYDTTNETWMQNIHKNNAAATLLVLGQPVAHTAGQGFLGTSAANANNVGFGFYLTAAEEQRYQVMKGSAPAANDDFSGLFITDGVWCINAVSVDEANGAGASLFMLDDELAYFDATYSSPSASSATFTMQIGAVGNAILTDDNGFRYAMVIAWSRALPLRDLHVFRQAARRRMKI